MYEGGSVFILIQNSSQMVFLLPQVVLWGGDILAL